MSNKLHVVCPHCETSTDSYTSVMGRPTVSAGDFNLCPYCARWSVIARNVVGFYLRRCTPAELRDLAADPSCVRLTAAVKQSELYRGKP